MNEFFSFIFRLLLNYSALQAIIDGKQKKQTPQVLTAINVLQLIVPQAPNLCVALLSVFGSECLIFLQELSK
jgi:hypothetical protein